MSEGEKMDEGYLKIEEPKSENLVVFKNYSGYEKALDLIKPKAKYSWEENRKRDDGQTTVVGFICDGVRHALRIPRFFPSISDFIQAEKEGFRDYNYSQWKQIKKLGYITCSDFDNARGDYELEDWNRIVNMGYKTSEDFKKDAADLSIDEMAAVKEFGLDNAEEYHEAVEMGFVNKFGAYYSVRDWLKVNQGQLERLERHTLDDLFAAKKGGFEDFTDFSNAKDKEFDNKKEWTQFEKSGFSTKEEFLQAKKLGIDDAETLKIYNFLASFEPDTPIAISRIVESTDVYEKELEAICQKAPISNLGTYLGKAGNFMRSGHSESKKDLPYKYVVMDGSNVAHEGSDDNPKLVNILNAKEKLESMGLEVITIVSASLRHKIDNPTELEKRIKRKEIIQTPAGKDNDIFIIQEAFEKDAFILSNDRFKDWKEANPNKAEEIEQRTVTFSITDEKTILFDDKLSILRAPSQQKPSSR